MLTELQRGVRFTLVAMALLGGAYHVALWMLGRLAFPAQAEGSLIRRTDGSVLGSTLIAENVIVPLELGQLPYRGRLLGAVLGKQGLRRLGKRKWRRVIDRVVPALMAALLADYVVLGGGNAKRIKEPPGGSRLSNNLTAFRGGFRLWHVEDVRTLRGGVDLPPDPPQPVEWRLI